MAKKPAPSDTKKGVSSASQKNATKMKITRSPEDELNKAFDPMKDLHLWTMWRSAVTGRIVDETKSFEKNDFREHPYGKSIVQIPLKRLIRLEENSREIAIGLMNPMRSTPDGMTSSNGHRRFADQSSTHVNTSRSRHGTLGTKQFVFYGVPRAKLGKKKSS